jgi:hypothetical protein
VLLLGLEELGRLSALLSALGVLVVIMSAGAW